MPRQLTVVEMLQMRQSPSVYFKTIDDYRDFAASMIDTSDVTFLCSFLDGDDPLVASRSLTAAFYFGGVLGIGDKVLKWFERDWSEAIDVYAPAVMQRAIVNAADVTAIDALQQATHRYGSSSAAQALEGARAAFTSDKPSWSDVTSGDAWRGGHYLLQQLAGDIEQRESRARIIWFLKRFMQPDVEQALRKYIGAPDIGALALQVLICFLNRPDFSAHLFTQPIGSFDDAITLSNVAYWVYRKHGDKTMLALLHSLAQMDADGRIAKIATFLEETK